MRPLYMSQTGMPETMTKTIGEYIADNNVQQPMKMLLHNYSRKVAHKSTSRGESWWRWPGVAYSVVSSP